MKHLRYNSRRVLGTAVAIIALTLAGVAPAWASTSTPNSAWLNSDGTLGNSASSVGSADGDVRAIVSQADGKLLFGGGFHHYGSTAANGLVRLNTDGSIDTGFLTNIGSAIGTSTTIYVYAIGVDSLGRIIVAGNFTTFNGAAAPYLVRLNSNGTRDTAFDAALGAGPNNQVQAVAVDSQDRIVLSGLFNNVGQAIGRLLASGAPDTAFNAAIGLHNGLDSNPKNLVTDATDRVVATGPFTSLGDSSAPAPHIIRYNVDGSVDTAFLSAIGSGANGTGAQAAIDSTGHIVLGGQFTQFNGIPAGRLVRLEADGTVDTAFLNNLGAGFSDIVWAVAIDSGDRILVGGGWASGLLARLAPDGTPDTAFSANLGAGFNSAVLVVGVNNSCQIAVGGWFASFAGTVGPLTPTNSCPPPPTPPAAPGSSVVSAAVLAETGAAPALLLGSAGGLLLIGLALVALRRERRI